MKEEEINYVSAAELSFGLKKYLSFHFAKWKDK